MIFESRMYHEIEPGMSAELRRLCTADDIYAFVAASGNHNPMHLEHVDAEGQKEKPLAPGLFVAALISSLLGSILPGPGTRYRDQQLTFHDYVTAGEELVAKVTVTAKEGDGLVALDTEVRRVDGGALVCSGTAKVFAPTTYIRYEEIDAPGLIVQRHRHFEALLEKAEDLPELATAVVCPEEQSALEGALIAAERGLIRPILIGVPARIEAAAKALGKSLSNYELVEMTSHRDAARAAVALVREGRAQAIMKGHLHTDDLLRPMLDKEKGLRIGRRFTHVFVMDVPGVSHPLLVTDAAINIAPDLPTKVDICQNAIDLAISLGMETPKVGVLSAVETVNPAMPSSIDAALLSKMAERGQIKGGVVDGPLAMDNAVDLGAARTKGLRGPVAGQADVLVVPGIDAGNMLAKQLAYISHAEAAGVVLGARVPVILNSRSDSAMARLASAAVASIHWHRLTGGNA
ncbi:bifunctional enoyl-CoA hydratase/phosphate acetyltransferase [Rhodobacter maris]|uniref:Phosphate butyryltransferase n=1 Tax=Rhodobacter maris TaxID=446682 RepID=A0A285SWB8_9RHOB|nr:bifunctional enoyl-CoA hydratase/phosphate acetyltransferase [Rhodobacter maris]SOC12936.1 phosphate butyryltransferase [Rhodobacter maris]